MIATQENGVRAGVDSPVIDIVGLVGVPTAGDDAIGSASGIAHVASRPTVPLREVVYSAESDLLRPRQLLGRMLRDVWAGREIAWRLFLRDIRAAHRQSLLGYFWIVAPPLAASLLFIFLHSQNILNVADTGLPYPVFVLTGMVLWETFAAALNAPLGHISASASMLTKLNFPREAILLTALYHVLFAAAIKLALLVPVFFIFGIVPGWTLLLAPLGLFSLVLLGFTLGLLLTPVGLLYQDIGRAMSMATSAWMLATPVIYPPPQEWPANLLNWLNPVSPLLDTTRQWLTGGAGNQWPLCLGVTLVALVMFLVVWAMFRLALPHVVARLSA